MHDAIVIINEGSDVIIPDQAFAAAIFNERFDCRSMDFQQQMRMHLHLQAARMRGPVGCSVDARSALPFQMSEGAEQAQTRAT